MDQKVNSLKLLFSVKIFWNIYYSGKIITVGRSWGDQSRCLMKALRARLEFGVFEADK